MEKQALGKGLHLLETEPEGRPHCATCDVDMWLVRLVGKSRTSSTCVFECKVCGAQATLSADDPRDGDEDRL